MRDSCEGHIAMVQVDDYSVEVVRPERATRASLLPVRTEHEVIDDQLRTPRKEVGQRLFAVRSLENVLLVHSLPRQFAPLLTKLVTQSSKFLFLCQKLLASADPLILRHNFMSFHCDTSFRFSTNHPPCLTHIQPIH